jgi:hypothetical protein
VLFDEKRAYIKLVLVLGECGSPFSSCAMPKFFDFRKFDPPHGKKIFGASKKYTRQRKKKKEREKEHIINMILDFAKSGDKASARAITLACDYFFFFFFVLFLFRIGREGMEDIFFQVSLSLFFSFSRERYLCFYFLSLSFSSVFIGTCARRA